MDDQPENLQFLLNAIFTSVFQPLRQLLIAQ